MIRRHKPHAFFELPDAAVARNAHVVAQQRPRRGRTEADNHLGPHQRDLLAQIIHAGGALIRFGHAVLRRPALDDVADIHLLPLQTDGREHLIQQLPGRADERTAGQILLLPRPLADKHQRRMQVALAEHHVRPRLTKPAFFAGKNRFRERWPRCVHAVRLPFSLSMPF